MKFERLRMAASHAMWSGAFLVLSISVCPAAAPVDESKLPPAASQTIEFSRDIQPIFDKTCFRCHGPEKPKSRFRLDNRESAVKGGEKGVDIIPGQSAKSPLIHFVARLVEDTEMPPEGKGDPLTKEQIGLLRAWIDQGVNYPATNLLQQFEFSISPGFRFVTVHGNQQKFREDFWQNDGWSGGAESFSLKERLNPDTTFSAEGRAMFDNHD